MLKKISLGLYRAWMIGCFFSFVFGAACSLVINPPEPLPLPWSGIKDFAEDSDGRVYVYSGMYMRVLCYERDGTFKASYPGPATGDVELGSDVNGKIYVRSSHVLHVYDTSWNLVLRTEADRDNYIHRTWILSGDKPLSVSKAEAQFDTAENSLARSGDCLFPKDSKCRCFHSPDGTRLELSSFSIRRYSNSNKLLVKYSPRL